ncbi:MAG TPA: cytochrome P450 [Caulobacteraceae bacterium]|nr:cytochrome P450 [Caulobacteraceae bacterium]
MSYEAVAAARMETIPAHVPAELVVDFNYFDPPGVRDDPHQAWKTLHDGPDVVYSPYNGGHWILTRADDMFAVMHDTDTFSSQEFTVPKRGPGPQLIPNQIDPPRHGALKSIVLRPLSPKSVRPIEPVIRELMAARIRRLAPLGRCEFVSEFTDVPPELFFEYAGLPKALIGKAKGLVDVIVHTQDDEVRRAARAESARMLSDLLDMWRAKPPSDDLFGVIIAQERAGVLTPEESVYYAMNVYHGGLETVSSALSFFAWFLARSPEHRRQLVEDPSLSTVAAEELLRRHGILNLARLTTRRTEFKDVTFEAGDLVMLPLHLGGLDDRKVSDPMTVDFKREGAPHPMFGTGIHRCVGSHLARPELRIFLEEWMKHIPDFGLDPDDKPIGASGIAMSMVHLPLVWPAPAGQA